MRILRFLALFSLFPCWMSIPAISIQNDESNLDQSYALSQKLGGGERLLYLQELVLVGSKMTPTPSRQEEWCLTLFRAAEAEPDQHRRTVGEKNALWRLSYANPALAIELLPQIKVWQPLPGEMFNEDFRSNAAEGIFVNFVEKVKPSGISTITSAARFLGETGQYPYRAMAGVIQHLPDSLRGETNNIVGDAIGFYSREAGFFNRDEEFWVLLRTLRNSNVNKDLMVQALNAFVQRLTHDPIRTEADYYSEIQTANGTTVHFTDRNQAFLFRAFPIIRQFNATLADQLLLQHPELAQATNRMHSIYEGFVLGNPTSEQAAKEHARLLQRALFDRIREQRNCNPQSLPPLAQRLTNVSARIAGFSWAIPAIAGKKPFEARSMYREQISELGTLENSPDQVEANVALAEAAHAIGDSRKYVALSKQAFDSGMNLFDADAENHPKARAQGRSGFDQLKELVTFAASQHDDILGPEIQKLPDVLDKPAGWLKAYLLLYDTQGHAKPSIPAEAPTPCSD